MKVCIIGSGLSALTLAKGLVNQNIYVDIFSQKKNEKINKSRTIGISKSNFNYFNRDIINIEKYVWKIKKIEIYSENLKNEKILNFENNNDQLFSIIKNHKIIDLLNKSLKNKYCKKLKFKQKLVKFNKYDLIIVTDYFHFFTKKFFNKKILKEYNSLAYTTIIHHKKISNNTAVQIFTKFGPLAFLPISDTKTSIVFSVKNLKNTSKQNIDKLILKYNSKYKIERVENLISFDLKSITLRSYYHDNILAFGDLLHRIHPLAGQGFNMTIRDVSVLLEIVKDKINLGLPLDSSLNEQFEKKTKHKNYIFSNSIDMIHEFFNLERKLNNSVLSKSIKFLGKNSRLNTMFTKFADKGINF